MKQTLRRIVTSDYLAPLWSPFAAGRVTIFTLHRFAVPDLNVEGHDPKTLAATLALLHREGCRLLDTQEVLDYLQDPTELQGRAVAFTVDDGYADFALVGADVFLGYDCPVTVFLTTGFLDGRLWQWWDQVEFVLLRAEAPELNVAIGERTVTVQLRTQAQRRREAQRLWALFKQIPDRDKWADIARLAASANVEIPNRPPNEYQPMSWDAVRSLEARGVRFGPHTDAHPILPRTTDAASEREIARSWDIVQDQLQSPLPVLAYPNGGAGPREYENARRCGLSAAFTTEPQYATSRSFQETPHGRFKIPRFGYPEGPEHVRLITSGFLRVKRIVLRKTAQ